MASIQAAEKDLAKEMINSYSGTYPNVSRILDALSGMQVMCRANKLDKVAHTTASQWSAGDYSPSKFRQLVAELSIIGRVRHVDSRTAIVAADFEYTLDDRLPLSDNEDCVFHPMFMKRFNIKNTDKLLVYPEFRQL